MGLIKSLWATLWKKELIAQDAVPKEVIKALAKKLDDMIDWTKVLGGKLKIFENYDAWAFEQLLNGFFAIFGKKLGNKAKNLMVSAMEGVASGDYQKASVPLKNYLAMKVDIKNVADEVEDAVLFAQVDMLFNILDVYIDKTQTPA